MNKYNNRKVRTRDGILHDSRKEAIRWEMLKLMEKAGEISDLQRQVKFSLIPNQYKEGAKGKKKLVERECSYIADFTYYQYGKLIVEDTKGVRTREYIIKRKLMRYIHNIEITEV